MDLCSSFSLNTLRPALWALPKRQKSLDIPVLAGKSSISPNYGPFTLLHSKILLLLIKCTPIKRHFTLVLWNPQNDHIYKLWTFFSRLLSKNIFLGSNVRFQKKASGPTCVGWSSPEI